MEISLSHLETVDAHLFVAAIRDVTAIRQAARVNDARDRELARLNVRMQATTRIFDAILGSADIAVARLDSDGVIERVLGSAVEPFFGAVADELTGNPVRRWRANAFSAFEQAVDHGTATELVPGAPSLQRAARIFQCSWLPDDDGVTLVAIDVTDEHQAERRVVLAEDRIRIAADLHDRVIGDVFSAALTVQAATSRLPASETKVKEQLGDVVDQLDVAISELRGAIFELHHRGETSLTDLVTSTVQRMNPTCSVSTTFGHNDDPPLSVDVTEQVDAILREAMTNAARHGKATALAVTTSSTPAATAISITDNGDGFEVGAEQRGNGLNNIIHRAALIGAAIAIDSAPGEGTTITLTLANNPDAAPTGPLPG